MPPQYKVESVQERFLRSQFCSIYDSEMALLYEVTYKVFDVLPVL